MSWSIEYSKDAQKFLDKHQDIEETLIDEIKKFILKLNGEKVSINLKKLHGVWEGYHRIRKGKIRIIFYLDYPDCIVYIDTIDFRGDVYK